MIFEGTWNGTFWAGLMVGPWCDGGHARAGGSEPGCLLTWV